MKTAMCPENLISLLYQSEPLDSMEVWIQDYCNTAIKSPKSQKDLGFFIWIKRYGGVRSMESEAALKAVTVKTDAGS